MIIYKVNMYLGLKGGLTENKFGKLHSTKFIHSDKELTEDEVKANYYEMIERYPRTHYLEITSWVE